MNRMLAALIAAGMLAGIAVPALAVDGHGNAERPELTVPNTGDVSGGPTHRDDPRISGAREKRPDGTPAHFDNDGHAQGHIHGRR